MDDDDVRADWHEQRGVIWAAGVAAVVLIALLVWAVISTATDSSNPGGSPATTYDPSFATSTARPTASTSSYPVPSAQTSQGIAPAPTPSADLPTADEPTVSTPTSTSIVNPYVTTTTQNGGAV